MKKSSLFGKREMHKYLNSKTLKKGKEMTAINKAYWLPNEKVKRLSSEKGRQFKNPKNILLSHWDSSYMDDHSSQNRKFDLYTLCFISGKKRILN